MESCPLPEAQSSVRTRTNPTCSEQRVSRLLIRMTRLRPRHGRPTRLRLFEPPALGGPEAVQSPVLRDRIVTDLARHRADILREHGNDRAAVVAEKALHFGVHLA